VTASDEQPKSIVRVTRILPARPEAVFAAWTDPKGFTEWFCPGAMRLVRAEVDASVGGRLHLLMRGESGDYEVRGVYREVNPPSRLVFTWMPARNPGEESLVTVELRPIGDQTEFVLTHERHPDEDTRARRQEGWESIVGKLAGVFAREHHAA
jgi:uncharacterized protein YndB with AHSA1/START domain